MADGDEVTRSQGNEMPPKPASASALPAVEVITPAVRLHIWHIQALRDVFFIAAVLALLWLGYALRSVTVPLLIALALAYLFEPLVSYLTVRLRASRPLVVSGLLVTVVLGMLIVLAIVVPLIIGQTIRLVQDVRAGRFEATALRLGEYVPEEYLADYERAVRWLMPGVAEFGDQRPEVRDDAHRDGDIREPVNAELRPLPAEMDEQRLRALVREEIAAHAAPAAAAPLAWWEVARAGARTVFGFIGRVVQLGLLAFLIPFYFFFFSVWYPSVVSFGRELVPLSHRARTEELVGKMDRAVAGFVRGRIVICFLMGVMLAIGWFIVGVPYSIVLGMVVGAFCLVPYLGGVGVPLAVGFLAFDQMQLPEAARMAWWGIILWPTLVFTIVQLIESYLLTPVISGKATNLDPVTILVAVLAGGALAGVYGMLLAIPVAACLKILITEVLLPRVRAWSKGEAHDPLPLG